MSESPSSSGSASLYTSGGDDPGPRPYIRGVEPGRVGPGPDARRVRVFGGYFLRRSAVWVVQASGDLERRKTSYVAEDELLATLEPRDVAKAGPIRILVRNPDGGSSDPVTLDVIPAESKRQLKAPPRRAAAQTRASRPQPKEPPPEEDTEKLDDARPLSDRPAKQDELGRLAFAWVLASRLREVRDAYEPSPRTGATGSREAVPGPFLLHLHGAWGVGKSTLLGFLRVALEDPRSSSFAGFADPVEAETGRKPLPYSVVEFNAWQHQRIAPPWWWLMTAVYRQAAQGLSRRRRLLFRLSVYRWRWKVDLAFLALVAAACAAGWVMWRFGLFSLVRKDDKSAVDIAGGIAGSAAAVIALGATLWQGTMGLRRWLLVASARGAARFMRRGQDPMGALVDRFERLIGAVRRPVVIFVDDLDRCQARYIVELLEGIQTLFIKAPVQYVVAADREWIRESFRQVYEPYADAGDEPGRPLGHRFLEKTFQLTTSVPVMSPEATERYWHGILGLAGPEEKELERVRAEAGAKVAGLGTQAELEKALRANGGASDVERLALVEASVARSGAREVRERTEHMLTGFAHLLERNPRTIKRLANLYGFEWQLRLLERGLAALEGPGSRELALWTILTLRWPILAEYLSEHPDAIRKIVGNRPSLAGIPVELRSLFVDPDVRRVVRGESVDASLGADTVSAFARPEPIVQRNRGAGRSA